MGEFQPRRPLHKFLLAPALPLPPALHSWGCQVLVCPCGCRGAFSEQRLDRCICAVLVKGTPCPSGALNFRRAREVALFSGFNPNHPLGDDPRLALALVGQLASPLQSAWISCHMANALHSVSNAGLCRQAPEALLQLQRLELLAQAESAGLTSSQVPQALRAPGMPESSSPDRQPVCPGGPQQIPCAVMPSDANKRRKVDEPGVVPLSP